MSNIVNASYLFHRAGKAIRGVGRYRAFGHYCDSISEVLWLALLVSLRVRFKWHSPGQHVVGQHDFALLTEVQQRFGEDSDRTVNPALSRCYVTCADGSDPEKRQYRPDKLDGGTYFYGAPVEVFLDPMQRVLRQNLQPIDRSMLHGWTRQGKASIFGVPSLRLFPREASSDDYVHDMTQSDDGLLSFVRFGPRSCQQFVVHQCDPDMSFDGKILSMMEQIQRDSGGVASCVSFANKASDFLVDHHSSVIRAVERVRNSDIDQQLRHDVADYLDMPYWNA